MTEIKPFRNLIRTFVIVHPDGTESGSYRGRSPRQAALKAIKELAYNTLKDGEISIRWGTSKESAITFRLREHGTKKIHVFKGHVETVKSPEKRPAWIPATIKVAHVQKIGIEKINRIGPALVAEGLLTNKQLERIEKLPVPEHKESVN